MRLTFLFPILFWLPAGHAQAPDFAGLDAQAKGLAIARESEKRFSGFGDSTARVVMVLANKSGAESKRLLRIDGLEVEADGEGDKTMIIFDEPRDVKGTALLTHANILAPDDQWLFLPTLKRTKRISSVNKSGPFVGSEFSYEDLGGQELEKYSYRWLRDEACGDQQCHVIERTPLYEHSGYTKQHVWLDTQGFRSLRTDYFGRRGQLVKSLYQSGWQLHKDRFWRSHDLFMQNHQTGKTTRLVFVELELGVGLDENDFTRQALERAG